MRKRSPSKVPGTNRPSSDESEEIGRAGETSVGIIEAGEADERGAAQFAQKRLVSGFSVAHLLHFVELPRITAPNYNGEY